MNYLLEMMIYNARKACIDERVVEVMTHAWETAEAYERESCALLCEQYDIETEGVRNIGSILAHRIRAREAS